MCEKYVQEGHIVFFAQSLLEHLPHAQIARAQQARTICPGFRWIANRKIVDLHNGADVFIMPSIEEGFPRVLLEAMSMGLPFVATDVGGVRDICTPKQHACLVPPRDVEQFADRLVRLVEDEDLRRELALEGLIRAKEFAMDRVISIFLDQIR